MCWFVFQRGARRKNKPKKGAGCCGDVEEKTFPDGKHHPSWGWVNSRAGWSWDLTESGEMRETEEFPTSSFPPPCRSQSISSQTSAAVASESVRGWVWAGRNKNGIKYHGWKDVRTPLLRSIHPFPLPACWVPEGPSPRPRRPLAARDLEARRLKVVWGHLHVNQMFTQAA